jgi:CubicO group peptidase (beta-lactamase class C family)
MRSAFRFSNAFSMALCGALLAATLPAHRHLHAQSGVRVEAGKLPVSASTVFHPQRLARLDSSLEALIARQQLPGAVVLLIRDGRIAYEKAYGVRDVDSKVPLRTTDLFRLASQTKAVTSIAAMMLWEEGKFGLDDPLDRYLPEFRRLNVLTTFNATDSSFEARATNRRITIRQLFTHTAGFDYPDIGSEEFTAIYAKAGVTAGIAERNGATLEEKMRVLARLPLRSEPGERFTYSISIDVLGRLIEVLSGQSLDAFFRTRIFTPLRMNDTFFGIPASHTARLVSLHEERDGKVVSMPVPNPGEGLDPNWSTRPVTYFSGGSGLSGTTADYARFLQMMLNGGELDGVRLLARKTVQMMLTNQIGALQPNYGLGFALETEQNDARSPKSPGSFWWSGAFQTFYWVDPQERLIALCYTNVLGSTVRLGALFETLVYGALK